MPTLCIVEPLNVVEHIRSCIVTRLIVPSSRSFGLQRREEAFDRRVVPAITAAAHTAGNTVLLEQPLEVLARILAALVRVMQQSFDGTSTPDRHQHRVADQLRRHLRAHRPADDTSREQIHHDGYIQPTLRGPQVR